MTVCYDFPLDLIVLFFISVVVNILQLFAYMKLASDNAGKSKAISDMQKILKKFIK